jgi:hypothetical protein
MPLDDNYQAKWDAETLAEAATIQADPARLAAASAEAGKMVTEAEAKAEGLKNIQKKIYDHPSSVSDREAREAAKKSA